MTFQSEQVTLVDLEQPVVNDCLLGRLSLMSIMNREQGVIRPLTAVLVAGSLATVVFAGAKGGYIGSLLGEDLTSYGQDESKVTASVLKHNPVDFACGSQALVAASGNAHYATQILDHDVPSGGGTVTLTATGKDGKEIPTKLGITYCLDAKSQPISYVDGPVDPTTHLPTLTIKIPESDLRADVKIVENHVAFNPDAGAKIVGGNVQSLAGAAELVCDAATFGLKQKECKSAASNVDATYRDMQTNAVDDTERALLDAVQKQVSAQIWSSTKAHIVDGIKDDYVNMYQKPAIANNVTVTFVDGMGNPTNNMPDFGKDLYQNYRDQGLIQNPNITSKLNFKVNNTDPDKYVSKYPTPQSKTGATK